jgi:DNA-binding NarL/FixJ family response regulator
LTTAGHRGMSGLTPAVGVVAVDDQAVFRAAVHDVIEATPGFTPLAEVASGEEALSLVRELRPELVLIDLRMPDMDGVETARRLRQEHPRVVVVLISLDEPTDVRSTMARSGAAAFVRKQDLRTSSLPAVWAAHSHRA